MLLRNWALRSRVEHFSQGLWTQIFLVRTAWFNRPFAQLLPGLETGHPMTVGQSPAYDFSVKTSRKLFFLSVFRTALSAIHMQVTDRPSPDAPSLIQAIIVQMVYSDKIVQTYHLSISMHRCFDRPAAGSGIPELIGFLNGTVISAIFNVKTFFVKFFSCVFAVASGLPVGPEGPMIHLG